MPAIATAAQAAITSDAGPALDATLPAAAPKTIDARGSFCPGPLMELIRGIRESQVGDTLAVLSSDNGSGTDIPRWIEKAGHRLIAIVSHDGYDEIVVQKVR